MGIGSILGGGLGAVIIIVVGLFLASTYFSKIRLGEQIQKAGFEVGRQAGIAVVQLPGRVAVSTGEQIQRTLTGGKLFSELGNQNGGI